MIEVKVEHEPERSLSPFEEMVYDKLCQGMTLFQIGKEMKLHPLWMMDTWYSIIKKGHYDMAERKNGITDQMISCYMEGRENGLSMKAAAEKAGFSQATACNIEKRRRHEMEEEKVQQAEAVSTEASVEIPDFVGEAVYWRVKDAKNSIIGNKELIRGLRARADELTESNATLEAEIEKMEEWLSSINFEAKEGMKGVI